jgi:uncharacterized membrane protein
MKNRRTWIILLSLLGIFVSGYLSWSHFSGEAVYCGGASSCELVNSSRYAYLGNIPVAVLGLLAYLAILALSLIPPHDDRQWPEVLRFGLALIGVMFQWYLFYIEVAVLHAFCYWCIASQAIITVIFILSLPVWRARVAAEEGATTDHFE